MRLSGNKNKQHRWLVKLIRNQRNWVFSANSNFLIPLSDPQPKPKSEPESSLEPEPDHNPKPEPEHEPDHELKSSLEPEPVYETWT